MNTMNTMNLSTDPCAKCGASPILSLRKGWHDGLCSKCKVEARLIQPCHGKGWSLQFLGLSPNMKKTVRSTVVDVNSGFNCYPFFQGDMDDWMMVEFWSNDESQILELSLKVCEHLDFDLEIEDFD
jgi:hypothetical protein